MASLIAMPFVRRLKRLVPWKAVKKALTGRPRPEVPAFSPPQRLVPASTEPGTLVYLPATPTGEEADTLRGAVDSVTGTEGIVGWLLDPGALARQHELELVADGQVVLTTETVLYRDDLGLPATTQARPGFRFAPAALVALLDEGKPTFSRLAIRVAGSDAYLTSTLPTLSQDIVNAAQAAAAQEPDQVFLDPLDFSIHLHQRRQRANALLGRPLRPHQGTFDGYIEMASPLNGDTLMLVGWMKEAKPIDFAAVVMADRRYPAAFSGRTFSRPDLQKPAIGWVAFVRTDWRPEPGREITVYWGMQIPFYLHGNHAMRVIAPAEAGSWIAAFEGKLPVREYGEFLSSLSRLNSWVSAEGGLKEAGITYGIDAVLVVPGFGVLIAGWIASPQKRLRNLSFRTGQQVAAGDRRSLNLAPRYVPDAEPSTTFRCAARALLREGDIQQPMLRFSFEDGTAFAVRVPRQAVRLADGAEALAMTARFFPFLVNEPFVDDLAQSLGTVFRRRAARSEPVFVAPAGRVAVLTLPSRTDDLLLALAAIRHSIATLPPGVGLALLTGPKLAQGRIAGRLADLGAGSERPLSLFVLDDPMHAFYALHAVLSTLGAERFWFCGPDVIPTPNGWRAAASFFAQERSGLELFLRAQHAGGLPEPESLSLAWSTEAFAGWSATAPFFLGGFHRDNRLPPPADRHADAIGVLRTMVASESIRGVDERLYRASMPGGALTDAAS